MARDGIYGESAHGLKIGVARYKSVLVGQNGRSKGGCRDHSIAALPKILSVSGLPSSAEIRQSMIHFGIIRHSVCLSVYGVK